MKITKDKTFKIVISALFTAFIAVTSPLSISTPFGVPLTLQTFSVALCGYTLGCCQAVASVVTYIIIGAVGLPVFSGFQGGVNVLFGLSGGFIIGFIGLGALCGLGMRFKNIIIRILMGFSGIAVCHAVGVIQFAAVYKTGITAAFLTASAPYLLKDAVSIILAYFLSVYINRALKKIHR